MVTIGGDEFTDEALAGAVGVAIGGVEEIAACLGIEIEGAATFFLVGTPTPILAKTHGAEAKLGDAKSTAAKKFVVHGNWMGGGTRWMQGRK